MTLERSMKISRTPSFAQSPLSLAIADVGIAHAVPFVTEAAAGIRQHLPRSDLDRQLASSSADDLAGGPDPVAQRQAAELVEMEVSSPRGRTAGRTWSSHESSAKESFPCGTATS